VIVNSECTGNITRRDFLNGVAVTAGAALMPWHLFAAGDVRIPESRPITTHLRSPDCAGSHSRLLRRRSLLARRHFLGHRRNPARHRRNLRPHHRRAGGISGLSAAHFYRKSAGAAARILILDNHDDFGGHAKPQTNSASATEP